MDDNQILALGRAGEDEATEFLLQKYGYLVKREVRTVYLIGAETEDLAQEGMIGLFKAIRDYSPDKAASFSTFASVCIRRQIQNAITNSNRKKHVPLNSYVSLYMNSEAVSYTHLDVYKRQDERTVRQRNIHLRCDSRWIFIGCK